MCGINGFTFPDRRLVEEMNARIRHRGPDGEGVYVDDHISLGHTRLAILDLSPKGKQPMGYADDTLRLTFNGEIYNYQELRANLQKKGYQFHSDTDSEVILALYQEYGDTCVSYLNGIFAFAIWDKAKQRLFIARDRIGVKPLYYYCDQKRLFFSSEIKALFAHSNIPRELNTDALNIYLRMLYVPAPMTMFAGIKKLLPGSSIVWEHEMLSITPYWQPASMKDIEDRNAAQGEVRRLMREAVRMQLISDRPVGVFLSGGIDSSIVTGLAREATGSRIKTFSAAFDVAPEKFNADAELAKKTSAYFDTDHHEVLITGADAAAHLSDVVYHMDEPVANATQIATYILSKRTSQDVAVVLGGDGGDELFGGYDRYRLSRFITRYQQIPRILRRYGIEPFFDISSRGRAAIGKLRTHPGVERYMSFMAQKEDVVGRVLKPEANQSAIIGAWYEEQFFGASIEDPEKEFMWADIRSWLVDESLVRSDKMSMAFGLEQRVPILDHRLVELSLRIPTRWKIRGAESKVIFKEAMREYIPPHVLSQPKRGWFSPASAWFRRDLKPLAYDVLRADYSPATSALFDFATIRHMLDDHVAGRAYHMNILWALVTFQLWHRRFL